MTGNTYPIRDQLKSLGAKWDKEAKVWKLPALTMRGRQLASNILHANGCKAKPIA